MKALNTRTFDIYALSRPRGHAFGNRTPVAAYCSEDGRVLGALTQCHDTGLFGVECMRRRTDLVWSVTRQDESLMQHSEAMQTLESELLTDMPLLKIPPGEPVRPNLFSQSTKTTSEVFNLLSRPSHIPAAWVLGQVYLAYPKPDKNWASDFQTRNFHTRLWEAYLLACFREQGCMVKQEKPSPDFQISRLNGSKAWIEAVTANDAPYNHVSRSLEQLKIEPPQGIERQIGPAAVRFAKTIHSKLQRKYADLPHVSGEPFAIAIADFHAHGSMTWTRESLVAYLYGFYGEIEGEGSDRAGVMREVKELLGTEKIPAGLFRNPENSKLSAIVFSNAATISKFNRMGYLAGGRPPGLTLFREGILFDRTEGSLNSKPFYLDVNSEEYAALWPNSGETWSIELEIFHNPLAEIPFPQDLLPECTHWLERDGQIAAKAFYANSILTSKTHVRAESKVDLD